MGNISSSYIVGKLGSNIDVREYGSGNLGTTNAYRVLGLKAGALVFIGDVIKGIIATVIGLLIVRDNSIGGLIGGITAVAGHNWPFLLEFKGGKGHCDILWYHNNFVSQGSPYSPRCRSIDYCPDGLCIIGFRNRRHFIAHSDNSLLGMTHGL